MRLYVASYTTLGAYDMERDDPSIRDSSLFDFGSPQFHSIKTQLTNEWLEELKSDVAEELMEGCGYSAEEVAAMNWSTQGPEVPAHGRPNQCWDLKDDDEDVIAVIVIQHTDAE